MGEEPERSALNRLISVPGLVALAILGIAVAAVARFFGPGNVLREVVTEVVASFGSAVLVLAVFGLLFRTGLERLLRRAPGGEAFSQSVERLEELAGGVGSQERVAEGKLDRIEKEVHSLIADEIPALRRELTELRNLLAERRDERDD